MMLAIKLNPAVPWNKFGATRLTSVLISPPYHQVTPYAADHGIQAIIIQGMSASFLDPDREYLVRFLP
jgi:hypothetical protein